MLGMSLCSSDSVNGIVVFCWRVKGMCGPLFQVGRCVKECDGRPWDWRDGGFRLSPPL